MPFARFAHATLVALPSGPLSPTVDADAPAAFAVRVLGMHAPGWWRVAPRFAENALHCPEVVRASSLYPTGLAGPALAVALVRVLWSKRHLPHLRRRLRFQLSLLQVAAMCGYRTA